MWQKMFFYFSSEFLKNTRQAMLAQYVNTRSINGDIKLEFTGNTGGYADLCALAYGRQIGTQLV